MAIYQQDNVPIDSTKSDKGGQIILVQEVYRPQHSKEFEVDNQDPRTFIRKERFIIINRSTTIEQSGWLIVEGKVTHAEKGVRLASGGITPDLCAHWTGQPYGRSTTPCRRPTERKRVAVVIT